ncbi:MAG: DUF3221 domain-containing protein [Clostridiales bacterium]|nr:DUF3221 domain-containing protein [Clostridiales bacterium]
MIFYERKKLIVAIIFVIYTVMLSGAFYLIGNGVAAKKTDKTTDECSSQTFYATISNIQGDNLTVKGVEINDINFRGNFVFSIGDETKVTWRYTDISSEDLDTGDTISITFTGEIRESEPAQITQVKYIQLLDDEK